jgi:hypothetical protein
VPDAGVTTSPSVTTFAVDRLFLGETTRDGVPSNAAWKEFGLDLDGRDTTADSTDVCTLFGGAPRSNQTDGVGGIDNAWGSVLMPVVETMVGAPTPSVDATGVIASGEWTLLIQVTGLSDDPAQTAAGLGAQVFVGAQTAQAPAFDSSTDWPIRPSSVTDASKVPFDATVQFSNVYVTGGTLVARDSNAPLTVPLVLVLAGGIEETQVPITIHDPIVTFDHFTPATAANGTIAGVMDTAAFVETMQRISGRISLSLCGRAFDGIADQLRQAQDILSDGTNAPGPACDGISIGLGFTAKLVASPTTLGVDPPLPDLCADAGAD